MIVGVYIDAAKTAQKRLGKLVKIRFQLVQVHVHRLRQGFLQNALLNQAPCPGFALLHPVTGLGFFQSVLVLKQFLLIFCHLS